MSNIKNNEQLLALAPKAKEYLADCGEGLFLRVRPNGNKSWVRRYTKLGRVNTNSQYRNLMGNCGHGNHT